MSRANYLKRLAGALALVTALILGQSLAAAHEILAPHEAGQSCSVCLAADLVTPPPALPAAPAPRPAATAAAIGHDQLPVRAPSGPDRTRAPPA